MGTCLAEDRIAIQDLICRMGVLVDNRELDELPQLFSADATFNYRSWGPRYENVPAGEMLPMFTDFIPGFDATTHQTTNFEVVIDGDAATSRSVVTATHRIDDKLWTVGGIYKHELRRIGGGWKISKLTFEVGWQTGEQIVDLARVRAQQSRNG